MIMCSKANNFYLTSKCFVFVLFPTKIETANRNERPVYELTIIGILTLHKSIIWCLVNSKSLGYYHLRKCRPPKSCTWKKKHTRKKMEWRKSTQVHIPSLARSFSYHVPYHSRCVIFNLTIDTDGVLHSPKKKPANTRQIVKPTINEAE